MQKFHRTMEHWPLSFFYIPNCNPTTHILFPMEVSLSVLEFVCCCCSCTLNITKTY